jgi:hypothetical protein
MTRRFDDDDDDDILKDGQTLRVSMMMRDGSPNRDLTPLQLEIARASRQRDARQNHMTVVDALGRSDQLHLRQPGARYAVYDAGSNEQAMQMQQTLRAMRDEAYASASADASNAWKKGGDREIGMSLDSASITDARERAYEDYQNYISNAWRAGR